MDARDDVDFWGITEHGETDQHPFDRDRPMAGHIQSHWIAVRRRMFTSPDWAEYWDEMPMIDVLPRVDRAPREPVHAVVRRARVPPARVAFPAEDYDSQHPIMDNVAQMVRDGCPIVKRRSFFHDPLYNESKATDGRQVARLMAERGYPMEHVYAQPGAHLEAALAGRPTWR